MIQVILKAISMFCSLGGPNFAPFFMPFVNPASLSFFVSCVLLPLNLVTPNVLNSEDNKTKSFARSAQFGFLIYYLVCFVFLCVAMRFMCNVSNKANPY